MFLTHENLQLRAHRTNPSFSESLVTPPLGFMNTLLHDCWLDILYILYYTVSRSITTFDRIPFKLILQK